MRGGSGGRTGGGDDDIAGINAAEVFCGVASTGGGIGRRLTEALIDLARRRGSTTMRLDTGCLQTEAHALYRSLGFVPIPPYYECSDRLRKVLVFMELALRPLD